MDSSLALLPNLTNESAVDFIQSRFESDKPYTIAQEQVLVVINPMKEIENINGKHSWTLYDSAVNTQPHVYTISSKVKQQFDLYAHQAIIICGESGSGKTTSARLMLEHLADNVNHIALNSNPVLEAFGNAVTEANLNSSRFGKVLNLNFDPVSKKLANCQVDTFLFERSRVCGRGNALERNFHVFYQLMSNPEWATIAGVKDGTFQILHHARMEDFTSQDEANFATTLKGLEALGMSSDLQHNMAKVLGAILQVGNLTAFSSHDNLSALLQTPQLNTFFQKRSVFVRKEIIWIENSLEQSIQLRDMLCKELYMVLVQYLLSQLNRKSISREECKTCCMIDIMGFECLPADKCNTIQQLLINYANEKLFDLFCYSQISSVEEEYVLEGIRSEFIESVGVDNVLLRVFETPQIGLWRLLESECHTPGGSDSGFVQKLQKHNKSVTLGSKRTNTTLFILSHFAQEVKYDATGFLETSQHKSSHGLTDLLASSALISSFQLATEKSTTKVFGNSSGPMSSKLTIGTSFQREMSDLVKFLQNTDKISWIRCIRPNAGGSLDSSIFNREYVSRQLSQSGILAAIRVSRQAFPIRLSKAAFDLLARYSPVTPDAEQVKFGKTMVYLTESCYSMYNSLKRREESTVCLQAYFRGFMQRRSFSRILLASKTIQRASRHFIRLSRSRRMVMNSTTIKDETLEMSAPNVSPIPMVVECTKAAFLESIEAFPTLTPIVSSEERNTIALLERLLKESEATIGRQQKTMEKERRNYERRIHELQTEVWRLREANPSHEEGFELKENDHSKVNNISFKAQKPKRKQPHLHQQQQGILGLCMMYGVSKSKV